MIRNPTYPKPFSIAWLARLNTFLFFLRLMTFSKIHYLNKTSDLKKIFLLTILGTKDLYIILADDDNDDQELFEEAVSSVNKSVSLKTVNNGEELLKLLNTPNTRLPHLIFLDINMPVKNGLESLAEIKRNVLLKDIPVIIYSTSNSEEQINKSYTEGADYYITKPDSFNDLKLLTAKIFSFNWNDRKKIPKDEFVLSVRNLK